uniref:Uncharacterized protein n=1 Tax=Chenopodium quinoa TaxID=63459 RepID=A0A803LLC3_CHEQI
MDPRKRKVAILMTIVACFVMPSGNGITMYPAFLELLSDLDNTSDSYAWGGSRSASSPVSLGEELEAGALDQHPFPMAWIMTKLHSNNAIFNDHREGYRTRMHFAFQDLKDEDICWTPYNKWVFPATLEVDRRYITRLGPIFCNNFVVHHLPHVVLKQFGRGEFNLEGEKLDVVHHQIGFVDNRGSNPHRYFKSYHTEVKFLEKKICLLDEGDVTSQMRRLGAIFARAGDPRLLVDGEQELEAGALDQHPFPMAWIMTKLHSNNAIFNDHREGYRTRMHFAFQDLKDEDICWTPYNKWVFPATLEVDRRYITRLGPIFCNNFVVHHLPHVVLKQFGRGEFNLEGEKLDVVHHQIGFVDNRGSNPHRYFKSYHTEVKFLEKKICLLDEGDVTSQMRRLGAIFARAGDPRLLVDGEQELEAGALDQHPFPMAWIMTKLHSNNAIFNDHREGYRTRMHFAFQDLKDEDICWTPYNKWVFPATLEVDRRYITRLGPIFCNNFVVHHLPHVVLKQFGRGEFNLEGEKLDVVHHQIGFVDNRGSNPHRYFKSYHTEVKFLEKKICLLDEGDVTSQMRRLGAIFARAGDPRLLVDGEQVPRRSTRQRRPSSRYN